MDRDEPEFEKIRTRLHELTRHDQEIVVRMALTELNLVNAVKDIDDHETAIRKLEKFMYTILGLGIAAQLLIQFIFKALTSK